jgi:hypothetical protein
MAHLHENTIVSLFGVANGAIIHANWRVEVQIIRQGIGTVLAQAPIMALRVINYDVLDHLAA